MSLKHLWRVFYPLMLCLIGIVVPSQTKAFAKVKIIGDLAYLDTGTTLDVLNLSDPDHPQRISQLQLGRNIVSFDTTGTTLLYMVSAPMAIGVVDITTPTQPQLLKETNLGVNYSGSSWLRAVSSRIAITEDNSRFRVFDVDNPTSFAFFGRYSGTTYSSPAYDLAVINNHAYMTYNSPFMDIYKLNGVDTPTSAGQCFTFSGRLAVVDSMLYVADQFGFYALDVSTPAHPTQTGGKYSQNFNTLSPGLSVGSDKALVLDSSQNLNVIDFSNPDAPVRKAVISGPWFSLGVGFYQNLAIASNETGYQIIDLTNPAHPLLRGHYTPGPQAITKADGVWEKYQ